MVLCAKENHGRWAVPGMCSIWSPPSRVRSVRHLMVVSPDNAERMVAALLATLDGWMDQAEEIADHAIPATGNAARALHLKMGMAQAKVSLQAMLDRSRSEG
jgi:hypothetical protein